MAIGKREVVVGGTYRFSGDNVISISTVENESILGSELSYDTLTASVLCSASIDPLVFKTVPYGTEVVYYLNGTKTGVFYLDKMTRESNKGFSLECISAIGVLDRQTHVGGLYKGETFVQVLADIIEGSITYYTPNAALNAVKIYGYLPYDTKRNNLRKFLQIGRAHV